MGTEYSSLVSVDDLSDEQISNRAESTNVSYEQVRETLSNQPIIEIGREDVDTDVAPLDPGGNSIIDPCPFCDGRHIHGFQDHKEGQGQVTPRTPHCDEFDGDRYWLVWRGEGIGEWVGDPKYTQSPQFV